MMNRVRTIVEKEWAEVFKNRIVLFTVGLLPVFFTAIPLIALSAMRANAPTGESVDVPLAFASLCGGMTGTDCMAIFMSNQFLLMFMIMPIMIPVTIAAYSVVGEKTTRSLEPLLATPITTEELLAGKSAAAVIPAILATVICFAVFLIILPLTGASRAVIAYITSPTWLLVVLVIGPLMAVLAVNFTLMVSSRANDPRTAEQVAAILIVPLLVFLFGQLGGLIVLNLSFVLIVIACLVVLDVGAIFLGAKLFKRETILTRWK